MKHSYFLLSLFLITHNGFSGGILSVAKNFHEAIEGICEAQHPELYEEEATTTKTREEDLFCENSTIVKHYLLGKEKLETTAFCESFPSHTQEEKASLEEKIVNLRQSLKKDIYSLQYDREKIQKIFSKGSIFLAAIYFYQDSENYYHQVVEDITEIAKISEEDFKKEELKEYFEKAQERVIKGIKKKYSKERKGKVITKKNKKIARKNIRKTNEIFAIMQSILDKQEDEPLVCQLIPKTTHNKYIDPKKSGLFYYRAGLEELLHLVTNNKGSRRSNYIFIQDALTLPNRYPVSLLVQTEQEKDQSLFQKIVGLDHFSYKILKGINKKAQQRSVKLATEFNRQREVFIPQEFQYHDCTFNPFETKSYIEEARS